MIIDNFKNHHILVIGDLMIDEYLWGEVDRISPEAPVQVVAVKNEEYTLGGSGNVVNNLAALGASVSAAGVVGAGSYGRLLLDKFKALGVNTGCVILDPERFTTRKTRIIAANQHVLRIDRETRKKISRDSLHKLIGAITQTLGRVDLVLISDYGKGVITPALLSKVTGAARKNKKITVADPKGLDFSKYAGVNILTPNRKEAGVAAGVEIETESDLKAAAGRILKTVKPDALLITCGKDGMVLFEGKRKPYYIRAEARQVFDVSGAGDTVLAVLGLALASGVSLREAAMLANTAAGIVVGKVGTATVSPQELKAAVSPYPDPALRKQKQLSELKVLAGELKSQGKRIVLTNGCFDLLHAGHVQLLSASKKLGDVLVVAIDDDRTVSKLKGPGRPVLKEQQRVRILSALDSVDYVVVFSSGQLESIIETLQPEVLTKGSNYRTDEVYGHEIVTRLGGRVVLIPVIEGVSSTRIINDIKYHHKQ
ncbi:MAG: D-glycero-beta-D-manno-heptose-7-phosphate kinase [Deltaproteobacteria bacterium]|nr:D-glycero-beta-D-manno-heptose-7-phosphate kinase [Deltaproteobacteria bacterium]